MPIINNYYSMRNSACCMQLFNGCKYGKETHLQTHRLPITILNNILRICEWLVPKGNVILNVTQMNGWQMHVWSTREPPAR